MKKVHVIIDASGSMREEGKTAALGYLLHTILHILKSSPFQNMECVFFQWSHEVRKLETIRNLKIEGRICGHALEEYFQDRPADAMILISDGGGLDRNIIGELKALYTKRFVISIGADSYDVNLKKIAGRVFQACDIQQVMERCLAVV